jgi:hypothetical protein
MKSLLAAGVIVGLLGVTVAEYPASNSTADVQKLCNMMPNMIGCSVYKQCEAGKITGKYCDSFSILGDICHSDTGMGGMMPCKNYNSICGTDIQCTTAAPIPKIVTTSETTKSIVNMCQEMPMTGCSDCSSTSNCPDPLSTISSLCQAMSMSDCASWQSMCDAVVADGESAHFVSVCGSASTVVLNW